METPRKTVFVIADDMFFSSKIENAAKTLGVAVVKVRKHEEFQDRVERNAPDLVIMDLASKAIDSERIFAEIRNSPRCEGVFCVGYLPHVERELADSFREKGVDLVIARSRFSREMGNIIRKHSKTR